MTANETKTFEAIRKAFAARYPRFPVVVTESPDDPFVLCVLVFAVPSDMAGQVKRAIREIGHELFPGGEYLLLPMVKNLEVTRRYYPEHMASEPTDSAAEILRRLFAEARKPGEWRPAILPAISAADSCASTANLSLCLWKITGGPLQPRRGQEAGVPADQKLALAA